MISERRDGLYLLHLILEVAVMVLGYWAWIGCYQTFTAGELVNTGWNYMAYAAVMAAMLVISALARGAWRNISLSGSADARAKLGAKKALLLAIAVFIYLVATKDVSISRVFLFSFLPVLFLLLVASELWLHRFFTQWIYRYAALERCILLSPDEGGGEMDDADSLQLRDWINRQRVYGLEMIGVIGGGRSLSQRARIPYLGNPEDTEALLRKSNPSVLMLTRPPREDVHLVYLIELCESLAIRLYVILDFNARTGRPTSLIESDGLDLLMFLREPLQNPVRRLAKRLFDILFSSMVLLIVFPFVALLTKFMQMIQSPGPMFFRQQRNGQSNRVFRIFKFRSMHDRDHEEQRQASRGDARIYPFGRLLRATSMDELPQFLNVLRGDMSVVGPRPHLTLHNDSWQRLLRPYHLRSYVKPGITGLAQTRGLRGEVGSDEEIRKRIECDIEYVENWSLMLDLWIVILTVWQIFFPPKKAY